MTLGWHRRVRALPRSLPVRLAAWHTAAVALLLATFSAGTWWFITRTARARADRALADLTRTFVVAWAAERAEQVSAPDPARAAALDVVQEFRYQDQRVLVFDARGRTVAVSDSTPLTAGLAMPTLAASPGPMTALVAGVRPERTRAVTLETSAGADAEEVPVRAWATRVAVGGRPFTVVALRSLRAEDEAAETFGTVLAVAVPLALVLAAAAGYWLTRASLAPAVAMGRQAERIGAEGIGAGSLHERLPTGGAEDELGQLAAAFNALLARVEHAFGEQARAAAQQRQFMADASHELRTPVAALTTVADVTLARPDRPATELSDALDLVRSEGRRLGRIVDELLLLARADARQLPRQAEPLYLEEVVQASVRAVRALATAGGVTLDAPLADEAPFIGDAHLLQRLLVALLDNAIKYTPPGGRVRVTLARCAPHEGEGARYVITVEDTGCGIAAEAQGQLFTRFFRADPARTRAIAPVTTRPAPGVTLDPTAPARPAGAGLGLAIARTLAALHDGTVALAFSGPEGSRFVVTLPAPV